VELINDHHSNVPGAKRPAGSIAASNMHRAKHMEPLAWTLAIHQQLPKSPSRSTLRKGRPAPAGAAVDRISEQPVPEDAAGAREEWPGLHGSGAGPPVWFTKAS